MNQSPKNLIRLMEAKGWILKRINGSHHIMFNPMSKQTLPVPVHGNRDIPIGLFLSLLKKAEIKPEEL